MSGDEAPDHKRFATSKLFDVSHVTALVTGGASGIGLMIVQALVSNGAKVYVADLKDEALQKVAKIYGSNSPGKIVPIVGNVSEKDDVLRLAKEIESKEPNGIQLLVNNAGIVRDTDTHFAKNPQPDMSDPKAISEHFLKSKPDQWADTFKTNVAAGFFMSMAFLPLLAKGQEQFAESGYTSSVVNVSSMSGAMKGSSEGQFAYASSKAAFTHLTRMLATTFVETKVRVNCISPGVFPSEMTAGKSDEKGKSDDFDPNSSNPAGRKGQEADMASTILFLASRGGVFYNHQILYPDGGHTVTEPAAN